MRPMSLPKLFLVLLVCGAAMCRAAVAAVGPDEHAMTWADAGLGLKDLKHYFNTPACEYRPRAMLGCLFAIEAVAVQLDPPQQLGFDAAALDRLRAVHLREHGERRRPGAVKLDPALMPHNFDGPLRLEPASEATLLAHRSAPAEGETAKPFFQRRNAAIVARLDFFAARSESRAAITWQTLLGDLLRRYLAQNPEVSQPDLAAELINLQLRIGKTPHDQISTDGMAFGPKREASQLYGIGVALRLDEGGALRIARVFRGGPAERAGGQAGDTVAAIDGWRWDAAQSPAADRIDEAVEQFLKTRPVGATLVVMRDGRPITLEVGREHLDDLRLEHARLTRRGRDYLYLHLTRFPGGGAVCRKFAALAQAHREVAGWIPALRARLTTANSRSPTSASR